MSNPIYFYQTTDNYGEFSNFAEYKIYLKDKIWPTTEHFFSSKRQLTKGIINSLQAQKFAGTPLEEEVRLVKSAKQSTKNRKGCE